ncbi:type III polyketide synthase [Promicromonospora thailandica]|uniref:Alkylresorcinol/alkylpyrone synthase n=1 Tax=Promicromonospora thailandica TaxID=765201 RepID=A0A9X2G7H5_9MICO|nr:3-oxoacyl-[acyl-carrier-protein] synthase III C-terminal domain-containing protein [Promicromonospora thailandica]MCP2267050.1 alkylresorcinol/alkylpyrone synthase [Promicromonospora thailandica]BFF16670.1 3-oxoacyl-[acyl-carrier-protein] synthase III C-terminal domain-containing protein [Promicromonospora thailandica]
MSCVVAVEPVLPEHVYPQEEITAAVGPLVAPDPVRTAVLRRLHAGCGVDHRHLVLPLEQYADLHSLGATNAIFVREAAALAERACRAALARAGLTAQDVDHVFATSVTGVAAPSLDVLLAERLGLRGDVRRTPSFGLGCAGGAAGLARVHDHLLGRPDDVALLVSVELCSLTLQHGDDSGANMVASGLFGDGAAAVVVVGERHPLAADAPRADGGRRTATLVDTRSRLYPGTTDALGWEVRDTGFAIVLSAELPALLGAHLPADVKGLLADHDLTTADVPTWVVHAGGPRVIDAVRDALELSEAAVAESRASLACAGNLSSSSVLDVLARTLARSEAPPGSPAVLMAFGPGVACELVLLRLGGR